MFPVEFSSKSAGVSAGKSRVYNIIVPPKKIVVKL